MYNRRHQTTYKAKAVVMDADREGAAAGEEPQGQFTSAERCPFLELPGELRNHIYRDTFGQDELTIDSPTFPEPALLAVCKQVRKEASPIFYTERKFKTIVQNQDSTLWIVGQRKGVLVFNEFDVGMHLETVVYRSPNWKNLLVWLHRMHKAHLPCPFAMEGHIDNSPADAACYAMFVCVWKLRDLEWGRVEPILEEMHKVLVAIDPAWA